MKKLNFNSLFLYDTIYSTLHQLVLLKKFIYSLLLVLENNSFNLTKIKSK
jgi:hypothetical protein